MKKLFALTLAAVLAVSLAACHGEKEPETTAGQPQDTTQESHISDGIDYTEVERENVVILSAIANAAQDTQHTITWETLEQRLMTSLTVDTDGEELEVSFSYRESQRTCTVIGLTADVIVTFGWNRDGQLTSVVEASSGGTYELAYSYDANGLCKEKAASRNGELASRTAYVYDENENLLTRMVTLPDGSVSEKVTFTYDEKGDLTGEITQRGSGEAVEKRYGYTYDEDGRLLEMVTMDEAGNQTGRTAYTYDEEGRKATESVFAGEEMTSRREFSYDEDGNLAEERCYTAGDQLQNTLSYTYTEVLMAQWEHTLYQMLLELSQSWL